MLKLYPSNRMERLADQLAVITASPLRDPLTPEIVVTQSLGMAHWLSLELARCHGIAANIRFLLPAALVWELFRAQSEQPLPEQSVHDRTALTWRILGRLPVHLDEPVFAPLRSYLAGDNSELKRYQLACRIADVFDQYLVFRPDLIESWDSGADREDWQAELWRGLSTHVEQPHRVVLLRQFLRCCSEGRLSVEALPERISVFGLCTLPPAHLEVLARVAEHIDVHLLFLNPSREYWGDVYDERAAARRRRWRGRETDAADDKGGTSPLLASLGQQGREFFERLLDTPTVEPVEGDELFEEPGQATLLQRLQSDILNLVHRRVMPGKMALDPSDDSVRFHVCHSPMREIEVLHDQLLALFEKHPNLEPRDIVVMAPDIETYAPYIEAVFSPGGGLQASSQGYAPRLPCSIADRAANREHPLLQSFLKLLQLPASRMKASEVLAFLETPAVRRQFQMSEEEFERIHRWVKESGVRWGLAADHRRELGLPDVPTHTWDFGLDRLFLGYALAPSAGLYGDIAPFEDIEGQSAEALGKLQSFLEALDDARQLLKGICRPVEWSVRVNALFNRFFAVDENEARIAHVIRDALAMLEDEARMAGFDGSIGLEVVDHWLQSRLAEPMTAQRFCTGQITFCSLLPMRSVPFRVVCLLGMNDNDFPRRRKPLGFDRIALEPRPGDRSRREDDRYLFLETLLSAREHLYVSYVGRNIRDNSKMLPSVVVSELFDNIEEGYLPNKPGARVGADLIVEHPMQPFSLRYFAPASPLFSYAAEWVPSSTRSLGDRSGPMPFVTQPIDEPDESFRQVSVEQLIRFFRNPARYFLENRLALFLDEEDDLPADSEPFVLGQLENYGIKQALLTGCLRGDDFSTASKIFAAEGRLPEPPFDRLALEQSAADVESLCARLHDDYRAYLEQPRKSVSVDVELDGFRLYGGLPGLCAPGLLAYRAAKLKAADRLGLWIRHVVLHAAEQGGFRSVHAAQNGELRLRSLARAWARDRLQDLMTLYWQGLRAPLRFFPETSYVYVEKLTEAQDRVQAEASAFKMWEGSDHAPGEGRHWAYSAAFRGEFRLFDPPFADLAMMIYQPLVDSSES